MCTVAASGLNLWCFNTVVWATNGLLICEIIFILFYQTVTKLQTSWISNKFNAIVESTNQVFFKAFTLSIPVGIHECNMRLGEQKSQLLLRWADRTAYI